MAGSDSTITERSRSIREWIESDGYDEASRLTLSNDDFARMMIYLLSIEKAQRYLTSALERLDSSPDITALLEKARQSEELSARVSASLIRNVRSPETQNAE